MYDNDLRTGTDYEYEHALDALLQKGYGKKTIKVKYAPDTEELADMGTVYIVTDDVAFIHALDRMKDYKNMVRFLDDHKDMYVELVKTPDTFDMEFDVSHTMVEAVQNSEMVKKS
ncbi:hypothetical protein JWV37_03530 [Sulfurospirillum sp. T05]|uniref:Uncharacterized protein n=1 Tax=Sulfurospirillum tamanense TaxID=2813362 RepID=A0ABS2WQC5_9BACT|nr:hypothetical protein [Sulfurospirillum tamanensis]MBN2963843.1 hypothetical protein [Sulfurospirillum tamanensis]